MSYIVLTINKHQLFFIVTAMRIDKIISIGSPRLFLPPQLQVLASIYKKSGVLYSGAFRAGKTLLLVNAVIKICLENPGVKGVLGSQTHTQLKSVVFSLFREELDLYQEQLRKNGIELNLTKRIITTAGSMEWEAYNGSIIQFRSCDEERKLAGYTLDFVGLDEPVDIEENVFRQLYGRLSGTRHLKNPFILLTTNPGSELHWIHKYFINESTKQDDFSFVSTTTYDNKLLPKYKRYINRIESTWDEDWKRRYLSGIWGMFEGQVYKEFNPIKHVGDFKDLPVKYNICGIDWGLNTPHCVLIMGVTENNKLVVKMEQYKTMVTTSTLSQQIAEFNKDYHFKNVYVDPAASDLIEQIKDRGVPVTQGYNDVENGIAKVKSIFVANDIYIDSSCYKLIAELQGYRYKPGTEIVIKKDDHAPDALRYGVTDYSPYVDDSGFGCGWWRRKGR